MSDLNSNHTDAVQSDADDAQWLATRYVLGELSDEQAETFEAAMSEDVALCEAVLQATLLNSAIALAHESQPSEVPMLARITSDESPLPVIATERSMFARFGVFAATAAMVLAVLAMVMLQNYPQTEELASDDDATADMLAMLLHNSSSAEMSSEIDEISLADDSVSSLVAPEWLLTAVDLDSAGGQDDIPVISPEDESGVY
jgi:anti-sigma-K factor RskA